MHLYLRDHVWTCRTVDDDGRMCIGFGYHWKEAYSDWVLAFFQNRMRARK